MLLHKRNFGIEINKKISTFSLKQTYHLKNEQINSSLVLSSNFYYLFKLVEISMISPKISSESNVTPQTTDLPTSGVLESLEY